MSILSKLKAFSEAKTAAQAAQAPTAAAQTPASAPMPPSKTLLSVLVKHLSAPRAPRSLAYAHASDLTNPNWCPRAAALFQASNAPQKPQHLPVALKVTFANGHALADLICQEWVGSRAYGKWICRHCKAKFVGRKPDNASFECEHDWRYHELSFGWAEYAFSGSIDLFVDLDHPDGLITAVELKTLNAEDFKTLAGPMEEHRIRTALYLALLERNKDSLPFKVDLTSAKVLYVSRGYGVKNPAFHDEILPFKEFTVSADPVAIKDPLARAAVLAKFKTHGKMPPRTCAESWTAPAKFCPAAALCFSGKYH